MKSEKGKAKNNNSKFKIFLVLVCCFSLFALSFKLALAYKLLQSLPGLGEELATEGGFTQYLSWIFRFALAAVAFLAVLQIVIGGIEYIAGGANESLRTKAHDKITNALWGVLLALAAWLILYTINPDLAKMKLEIPEIKVEGATVGATGQVQSGLIGYSAIPIEKRNFNIKSGGAGACKGGLNACQFNEEVVNKLTIISNVAQQMGLSKQDWQVTEAYPPTTKHNDSCHNNATCVDIAINSLKSEKLTKQNVDILIKAAQSAGFKVVNEYKQFGGRTYDTTTGGHLHIEL